MRLKLSTVVVAAGLALAAAQASAVTLTFEDLAEGATLSSQYAGLGVTFSPNAYSGPGSSSSGQPWATNTDMTIVSSTGTDVGGLGTPPLVSGNILRSFGGWLAEDGDPSFLMTFSTPVTSVSITVAGVSTGADVRFLDASGATLVAGGESGGQFVLSYSSTTAFSSIGVSPGSFNDWVGVDDITFAPVPEPATYGLMALGLGLLALGRRYRA